MNSDFKSFLGECMGTFVLVFLGCGIVGLSILNENITLVQIALVWGLAVFLGIRISASWSHAHLNPAVSVGFWAAGKSTVEYAVIAIIGQFAGAILAGFSLFLLFDSALVSFEELHSISRSNETGLQTAKMFGEYYDTAVTTLTEAMTTEGLGTAMLMFMILIYSQYMPSSPVLTSFFIGLTVTVIIIFIAPITQAGINPARDLGPRLISWLMGWNASFSLPNFGAILTYVVAPVLGAVLAAALFRTLQILSPNNNLT